MIFNRQFLILSLLSVLTLGCQMKPTKVREEFRYTDQVRVTEGTVILDTRSALDFNSARIPGSLAMSWEEFTAKGKPNTTFLLQDTDRMAQRLARVGIQPGTRVLIVGQGVKGKGDEGRLAWTLYYLGIDNVQLSDFATIPGVKLVSMDSSSRPAPVPFWKPEVRSSAMVNRKEVLEIVTGAKLRRGEKAFLLDVRTEKEFRSRNSFGGDYNTPNIEAIHIPWTEFFKSDGQINFAIRDQLTGIGITPDSRVVPISNHGVRSGAVTMALIAMGYKNAGNYVGGFIDLVKK